MSDVVATKYSVRMVGTQNLRYPIGTFELDGQLSAEDRLTAIETIAVLPKALMAAVDGLTPDQLQTSYRPGGWSLRQLIHHIADSDMTAYSWMRLALTEEWPEVFAYDPAALAELSDSTLPAELSLDLLGCLHERWACTLRAVPDVAWETRGYIHPETGRCTLGTALAMYAWHSRHHLAQILNCRVSNGW